MIFRMENDGICTYFEVGGTSTIVIILVLNHSNIIQYNNQDNTIRLSFPNKNLSRDIPFCIYFCRLDYSDMFKIESILIIRGNRQKFLIIMSDYEYQSSSQEASEQEIQVVKKKSKKKLNIVSILHFPAPNSVITINIALTHYEVIEEVAEDLGWKIERTLKTSSNWDILWTDHHIQPNTLFKLQLFQKVSHFPGIHVLSRKNLLGLSFMDMYRRSPEHYNFFPKTWLLPSQYSDLRKEILSQDKTFIVKPQADCQGRGIFLTQKIDEVQNGQHYVVQQYIAKPFLVDGLKFDFRVYVLLCGVSPLRLYIYQQGLARFATQPYVVPNKHNLKKQYMHLTNYAINKKNPKFVYNNSSQRMDVGHKRSLTSVLKMIQKKGFDVEQIKEKINDAIVKTIILGHPLAAHQYRFCQPDDEQRNMCFHILGIDIMLDSDCKPFVLEVNHTPSFVTDTPLDRHIKFQLIKDTLILMNITPQSRMQAIQKINKLQKQKNMLRKKRQLYQNLDKQQKVKLAQQQRNRYQGENIGRFTRIYPLKDQQKMQVYQELIQIAEKSYFSENNVLRSQMEKEKATEELGTKQKFKDKQKEDTLRKTIYEEMVSSLSPLKLKKIISAGERLINEDERAIQSPNSIKKNQRVGSYVQNSRKKNGMIDLRQIKEEGQSSPIKNDYKQIIKNSGSLKIKLQSQKNTLPKINPDNGVLVNPFRKQQNQYVDYRRKKNESLRLRQEKKKEFNYIDLKILKEKLSVKKTLMGKAEKEYSESEEDEA